MEVEIVYLESFMYVERRVLRAPIIEGEVVANILYILNGEVIFEGDLIASRDVYEYYFYVFTTIAFSLIAILFG